MLSWLGLTAPTIYLVPDTESGVFRVQSDETVHRGCLLPILSSSFMAGECVALDKFQNQEVRSVCLPPFHEGPQTWSKDASNLASRSNRARHVLRMMILDVVKSKW